MTEEFNPDFEAAYCADRERERAEWEQKHEPHGPDYEREEAEIRARQPRRRRLPVHIDWEGLR